MNRSHYLVGGLAALMLIVLVQSVGLIKQSAADVPSPSVAANPAIAPTPVSDAYSTTIDDLASWPIAATR
jgi:hypothetical protein